MERLTVRGIDLGGFDVSDIGVASYTRLLRQPSKFQAATTGRLCDVPVGWVPGLIGNWADGSG